MEGRSASSVAPVVISYKVKCLGRSRLECRCPFPFLLRDAEIVRKEARLLTLVIGTKIQIPTSRGAPMSFRHQPKAARNLRGLLRPNMRLLTSFGVTWPPIFVGRGAPMQWGMNDSGLRRNPGAPLVTRSNAAAKLTSLGSGFRRNDARDAILVIWLTPRPNN